MVNQTPKLAILGIGKWGRNLLRDFTNLQPECHVVTVVSTGNQENITKACQINPNVNFIFEYDQILVDPNIDAVIIATPIQTHVSLTEKALRCGKHVFVEKPPAQQHQDFERLAKLAQHNKLVYFTDNTLLYHPIYQELKQQLKQKKIIRSDLEWKKWGSFGEEIVKNLAYHYIYIALNLFGFPNKVILVKNKIGKIPDDLSEEESDVNISVSGNILEFEFRYLNGLVCKFIIDRLYRKEFGIVKNFKVKTSTVNFIWEGDKDLYLFKKANENRDLLLHSEIQPLALVCSEFIRKIKCHDIKISDKQLIVDTLKIINQLKSTA